MPVVVDSHCNRSASDSCIHIGLINNMPDEALKATERQYVSLLGAASHGLQIRLSLYTLPGVPRSETSSRHIASVYSNIDEMWGGELDGLIVTGREPLAADLKDEPYWDSFTKTLAWARENAHATVWSCLAAHAAVLHMDGIRRAQRHEKLFGVLECTRLLEHPLLAGTPSRLELPHSRWNSLRADQLAESGYDLLTRTPDGEVDTFIKQQKTLFVFFQGHPEYEADTLLREYRRDIGRYFKGETPRYPSMPRNYFNYETAAALDTLQVRSASEKDPKLLSAISAVLSNLSIANTWRSSATSLYQNWLQHIRVQKNIAARSSSNPSIVPACVVRGASSPAFATPAEA